jgi:long-chain acyl-CoA synthetase
MLNKGNRTIPNLLKKAAEEFETYNYLSYKTDAGWTSYTYSEIYQNSLAIGTSLKKLGIQKDDCLAIISEGSPMWVTSEHGILCAAAISVPLSVKLLPEEIPYRFNHAEVKAVFTSHNHLDKIIEIDHLIGNKEMFIIYLDEDQDYFYNALDKAGIRAERGLSYWNLLNEGRSILNSDPNYLSDRLNSIREDDVVNISYTSGTTGNPKGIMLSHLNYYSNAKDGTSVFRLEKGFRTLIILPIDHSFAHTVAIYGALFSALDIHFLDTRGGLVNALKNIPINLQEVKPQFLLTVPALSGNFIKKMKEGVAQKGALVNKIFMNGLNAGHAIYGDGFGKTSFLKRFLSFLPYTLASTLIFKKLKAVFGGELQYMVGGGALLDIKQQQFYYYIGNPVFQGYGLTEAAPIISANTPFDHKLGTSGKIMPGVTCKIMKDKEHEVQAQEVGEIVIKGDNVMKGYYKNEEATKESIRDGWLWTGDLGYMDKDGFLVVTGRNKALLIAEDGEKYSPEGIEEAIVNCSEMIGQAMIYNDHKKYTSAVLTIDPMKVNKIKGKSPEEILSSLKSDMNRFKHEPAYKGQFPEKWTPSTLFIAPEPFSEDNKMINSTLKMVRHKITTHYENEINTMYGSEGQKMVNELNIQSIGKILNSKS